MTLVIDEPTIEAMRRVARTLTTCDADADEAVSRALEACWRNRETYRPCADSDENRRNSRTWLSQKTRWECRYRGSHQWVPLSDEHIAETDDDDTIDVRISKCVQSALNTLRARQRDAVWLWVYDYPHADIAAITGRPLGTVKSDIRRAMEGLRAVLDADGVWYEVSDGG